MIWYIWFKIDFDTLFPEFVLDLDGEFPYTSFYHGN